MKIIIEWQGELQEKSFKNEQQAVDFCMKHLDKITAICGIRPKMIKAFNEDVLSGIRNIIHREKYDD